MYLLSCSIRTRQAFINDILPSTIQDAMSTQFQSVIPILRIFDIPKAEEFYNSFLGFTTDWSHRFEPSLPLYRQVSRNGLVLHLSEHHGDGSPGIHIRVMTTGLEEFHKELTEKKYNYLRPGLEKSDASMMLEVNVIDPFGNQITFCQRDT